MFAGDNVGSDAFGMWMVREAESKPCPRSPRWFCSMSCCSGSSDCARARVATALAASPDSTLRRLAPLAFRIFDLIGPRFSTRLPASQRGAQAKLRPIGLVLRPAPLTRPLGLFFFALGLGERLIPVVWALSHGPRCGPSVPGSAE